MIVGEHNQEASLDIRPRARSLQTGYPCLRRMWGRRCIDEKGRVSRSEYSSRLSPRTSLIFGDEVGLHAEEGDAHWLLFDFFVIMKRLLQHFTAFHRKPGMIEIGLGIYYVPVIVF